MLLPVDLAGAAPESALAPVGAALGSSPWRGLPRRIVVSDRLVRYLVVPRPEGIRTQAEMRLACEARFQASFDVEPQDWHFAIDMRPFATAALVCAMPRKLLAALTTTFGADGRLVALRPYLVSEWRRCAARLPRACWFAAVARDCVAIAAMDSRGCRSVRVVHCEQPSAAGLEELLARERLLAGDPAEGAPALVTGSVAGEFASGAIVRLDRPQWGSFPAARAGDYRLALSEHWQ